MSSIRTYIFTILFSSKRAAAFNPDLLRDLLWDTKVIPWQAHRGTYCLCNNSPEEKSAFQ